MKKETRNELLSIVSCIVIGSIIAVSLHLFFYDDSNGWGGNVKLVSWNQDSFGYHLNFTTDFNISYHKNFTTSKVTDFNPYIGHYVEFGYNSYEDRLNWIHVKEG